MQTDWNKFTKAYKDATTGVRDFVDSTKIPDLVEELVFDRYAKKEDKARLIQKISYVILSIATIEELSKSLKDDLSYSEENIKKIAERVEKLKTDSKNTPATADNKTTAESPNSVEPVHTMNTDMKRTHGYGAFNKEAAKKDDTTYTPASQEDLLSKQNLADIPKYEEGGEPTDTNVD